MLKITITVLTIFVLLSVSFSNPLRAQTGAATQPSPSPSPDLKKSIADEDKKYNEKVATTDAATLEKIDRQSQSNKLTTKQKVWLALGILAVAAIVFVVIKYGKDCKRTEPAGCNWPSEEGCTCAEYAQNL